MCQIDIFFTKKVRPLPHCRTFRIVLIRFNPMFLEISIYHLHNVINLFVRFVRFVFVKYNSNLTSPCAHRNRCQRSHCCPQPHPCQLYHIPCLHWWTPDSPWRQTSSISRSVGTSPQFPHHPEAMPSFPQTE